MEIAQTHDSNPGRFFFLIRLILTVLILGLSIFELFMSFRGLNNPAAMEQAQVARNIARGEGRTTKMLRPLDVVDQNKVVRQKDKNSAPNFNAFPDTYNAPLHEYALATALKLTGYDRFEKVRMDAEKTNIYGGDRVIAATSMVFFLLSLALAYVLFSAVFDQVLASTVVAFLGLSQLMLRFAVSGLAQPMLMSLLLLVGGCIALALRADRREQYGTAMLLNLLTYVLLVLMGLTHALAIWCMVGYIVFSGFAFRHKGLYSVIGMLFFVGGAFLPEHIMLTPMGGTVAKFLHSIYAAFGSDNVSLLMRSASDAAVPFSNSFFFLRMLGYLFDQIGDIYAYMGGIVVVPFFLLALFNRYKNPVCEGLKWAIFGMWICTSLGMACFGQRGAMTEDQIFIIFAPFFAAYGTALVFNFLGRMQLGAGFRAVRGLTIFFMILFSSGSFMFQMPQELGFSILTSARGIPQYPPYYPPALNGKLHDMTNAEDIIVTDQPWAVAWYADRTALWIPRTIDTYVNDLEPIFKNSRTRVQGFLITPTSHTQAAGGVGNIISTYGDFAPLVMEGKLLLLSPKHNLAFTELFTNHGNSQVKSRALANLVSSQGEFPHRNFLLGADIVYYSRDEYIPADKK